MMISNEDSSVSLRLCLKSWACCHDVLPSPPLSCAVTVNSEELFRHWKDCVRPSESLNHQRKNQQISSHCAIVGLDLSCIPPENSVVVVSDCKSQLTWPKLNVWLLALIETDLTLNFAGPMSNFQLICPTEEPSIRAIYAYRKKYGSVEEK